MCGGDRWLEWRRDSPGKARRHAGRGLWGRRKRRGARLGAPRSLPPPPPFRTGRGEGRGAGGAALTSLRAVPAREGGAGSRSEPGEAARRQEPPHCRCRARLPRLSAVRPPRQGRLESVRSRARARDRASSGAVEPLSLQPPHPRRCLAGPRPPSRSVSAAASRGLGEAGERGLGREGGSLG